MKCSNTALEGQRLHFCVITWTFNQTNRRHVVRLLLTGWPPARSVSRENFPRWSSALLAAACSRLQHLEGPELHKLKLRSNDSGIAKSSKIDNSCRGKCIQSLLEGRDNPLAHPSASCSTVLVKRSSPRRDISCCIFRGCRSSPPHF